MAFYSNLGEANLGEFNLGETGGAPEGPITLDKWVPEYRLPPRALRPVLYAYPWDAYDAFPTVPPAEGPVTLDKWASPPIVPSFAKTRALQVQHLNEWTFWNPDTPTYTFAEIDKWATLPITPRWDLKRWQNLYPSFHPHPYPFAESSLEQWASTAITPRWAKLRQPHLIPASDSYGAFPVVITEGPITIDKWASPPIVPRFVKPAYDQPRLQYSFPSFEFPFPKPIGTPSAMPSVLFKVCPDDRGMTIEKEAEVEICSEERGIKAMPSATVSCKTLPKDPAANKDYYIDWADLLDSDETISTSTWAGGGLTVGTNYVLGERAYAFLSGGASGTTYVAGNTITTSKTRTYKRELRIEVKLT